jgi:acyl-coenzyme A thioesterase PaaI-like protein
VAAHPPQGARMALPPDANPLARSLSRLDRLPRPFAVRARTLLVRRFVRFVGTAKLDVLELTPSRSVVEVKNRARVRNHIGGVHAAAVALIAETATGFVVAMSVPETRAPVIKSMKVEYKKRAKGGLRAEASLTAEQIEQIRTTEKGEVRVEVKVTDEAGVEPVICEMIWAWTPKRKPAAG